MSRSPVFIVSTGRAGSKMLASVFRQHPDVLALHEPVPSMSTLAYGAWAGYFDHATLLKKVRAARGHLVAQVRQNNLLYVESSHFCSHLIKELHTLFDARFIFMHRAPLSFVHSCMRKGIYGWIDDVDWSEKVVTRIRRRLALNLGRHGLDHRLSPPQFYDSQVGKAAWLWAEINQSIIKALKDIPQSAQMSLGLKELNEEGLEAMLDFCAVDKAGVDLKSLIALARDKPNFALGQVEAFSASEEEQYRKAVSTTALKLGYSV